jgi:hypothetical protein
MDLFECGNEELSILVTLDSRMTDKVTVQYDGGEMINASILQSGDKLYYELAQIPAAAGKAYAGYGKSFHAKGMKGSFSDKGNWSECKLVNGTQPRQAEMVVNMQGRSLGGKLRGGPGMNFAHVGSLAEGTWLTITKNSGVMFNGYAWFEVALDDGTRAYQWGGILCSNGQHLEGVYQVCH